MALYFMIFAREGVVFLAGSAFTGAVLPMRVIMPTLVLIGMTNVIGIQMLVPLGREKAVLRSVVAGAVVDVVLNIILIPQFSALGAAIGTLVAEMTVLMVQLLAIRSIPVRIFSETTTWKLVVAMALATAASIWSLFVIDGVLISLLVSAVCFFGTYGGSLVLLKEPLLIRMLSGIRHH